MKLPEMLRRDLGHWRRQWLVVVAGLFLFGAASAKSSRQVLIVEAIPSVLAWLILWNWLVFGRGSGRRRIPPIVGAVASGLALAYLCLACLALKPLAILTVGLVLVTVPWMVVADLLHWRGARRDP